MSKRYRVWLPWYQHGDGWVHADEVGLFSCTHPQTRIFETSNYMTAFMFAHKMRIMCPDVTYLVATMKDDYHG